MAKKKKNAKKKGGDQSIAALPSTSVSVDATDDEVVEVATDASTDDVVSPPPAIDAEIKDTTVDDGTTPEKKKSKGIFSKLASPIFSPKKGSKSSSDDASTLPPALVESLQLFTPTQQELAKKLCTLPGTTNQCHLFEHWSSDTSYDEKKKTFMSKLELVDSTYPDGGLIGYLNNAVTLLEKSRKGENPLEGWEPSVPKGEAFTSVGSDAFLETEKLGLDEVGKCGFVLVAGGLGERLGYGDIKVSFWCLSVGMNVLHSPLNSHVFIIDF
jgi:hypothetical protein